MHARRPWRFALSLILALSTGPSGLNAAEAGEFVVNFLPSELNLNPLITYTTTEAQIYTALFEGLVSYDPFNLNPVPGVAENWVVSDDGLTYTFTIRQSAKYRNGDRVTASHFRDAWLLLLDPDTNGAYSSLLDVIDGAEAYRTGTTDDPSTVGITVVSDRVLKVRLRHRATHFLRILCHHAFVPLHPSILGTADWRDPEAIVGNGPFFVERSSSEELILSKNEQYWDESNVEMGSIRITFDAEYDEVTRRFNSQEINWARGGFDLSSVSNPDSIVVNPLFATSYFQFSAAQEPFSDARVRRALALLLPWDEIRSEEYQYIPAVTLVPSFPQYPDVSGIVQPDPAGALELLAAAGYPDGSGLGEVTISIPGGGDNDRIAELMKTAWESTLGVGVVIERIPYPRYFEFIEEEEFTLGTISWIGDFADPLTFLDMWTSGSNLNNSRYSNIEFDLLVRRAMGESVPDRYETLAEAERILLRDAIVLPISHSPSINLVDLSRVRGWFPNPLDIHPFKYLQFIVREPPHNVAAR